MTHWQRVEATFHRVADDAPGPRRDARVLELCGHDTALAAEVNALLEADAGRPGVAPHALAGPTAARHLAGTATTAPTPGPRPRRPERARRS